MLKTSLLLLYGLPLALVFFWSYSYFEIKALNEFYEDSRVILADKTASFNAGLNAIKTDPVELNKTQETYLSYLKVHNAFKTTFNDLFEALEKVTPGDVMFNRIKISPNKLVRVVIEGEAEKLGALTIFVRQLFGSNEFLNPRLNRHTRKAEDEKVSFSLDIDYLGQKGELP